MSQEISSRTDWAAPVSPEEVPGFSVAQAVTLARDVFGVEAKASALPSERDQNFFIQGAQEAWVLKIANRAEDPSCLEAQSHALKHLEATDPSIHCPRVVGALSGEDIVTFESDNGLKHRLRLLTFVPGMLLSDLRTAPPAYLLRDVGRMLGRLDRAMTSFAHPGARRELSWDLRHAVEVVRSNLEFVAGEGRRELLTDLARRFESEALPRLSKMRTSVIHNDANDHNIVIREAGKSSLAAVGIIDFGDLVETHTVIEPAVAAAYAILGSPTLLAGAHELLRGYNEVHSLDEDEIGLVYDLLVMRLATSVAISARQVRANPDNRYLAVSEADAWKTLLQLSQIDDALARSSFMEALEPRGKLQTIKQRAITEARARHLAAALSASYDQPLHIVGGYMQYLYESDGSAYLDCVNNVPHVGHCHPEVVRAIEEQVERLNTNTRYLHQNLTTYAERLAATFPAGLDIIFFVNSGSEANELALRLARAHTGGSDFIVVDGAYHGNTGALIDLSPYKYKGPGGRGAPPHVHEVPTPDVYRGLYTETSTAGARFAEGLGAAIDDMGAADRKLAGFICESLLSCAGQIELPAGYLERAYELVRGAGGVCIADEVQVGFGRVGTHFWGFETQGVVPDIVTLGKPMGNGHPIGAVVTTAQIAASFADGMEYFNTFGGNPVSCAAGIAVLDVIEAERLQERSASVGDVLKSGLNELSLRYPVIGDVRGRGLFLGIEFVEHRETRKPTADLARSVVEKLKEARILASTDGPFNNVIKIKPPLQFDEANAGRLVAAIDSALSSLIVRVQPPRGLPASKL